MNKQLRQVQMWEAYDGTIHTSERDALLVSVATVLGSSVSHVRFNIEPHLPALLPLFQRLLDPRNRAPANAAEQVIETTTFDDTAPNFIGMDMASGPDLTAYTNQDGEPVAPPDVLELDDLREGQEFQTSDGWIMIIGEVTSDNNLEPCVIGEARQSPKSEPIQLAIMADEIVKVLRQPEDMMDLETAEATLKELGQVDEGKMLADADASKLHKRRILLLRRIEQLKKGEGE